MRRAPAHKQVLPGVSTAEASSRIHLNYAFANFAELFPASLVVTWPRYCRLPSQDS